jgi:hypothetical protein
MPAREKGSSSSGSSLGERQSASLLPQYSGTGGLHHRPDSLGCVRRSKGVIDIKTAMETMCNQTRIFTRDGCTDLVQARAARRPVCKTRAPLILVRATALQELADSPENMVQKEPGQTDIPTMAYAAILTLLSVRSRFGLLYRVRLW